MTSTLRERLAGASVGELAVRYGVNPSTASRVSRGVHARPLSRSAA